MVDLLVSLKQLFLFEYPNGLSNLVESLKNIFLVTLSGFS